MTGHEMLAMLGTARIVMICLLVISLAVAAFILRALDSIRRSVRAQIAMLQSQIERTDQLSLERSELCGRRYARLLADRNGGAVEDDAEQPRR